MRRWVTAEYHVSDQIAAIMPDARETIVHEIVRSLPAEWMGPRGGRYVATGGVQITGRLRSMTMAVTTYYARRPYRYVRPSRRGGVV